MGLASRVEQEIRAHPRLHRAFYVLITRVPLVRDGAGRVKNRVRAASGVTVAPVVLIEDAEVCAARERAVARRLGLLP